MPKPELFLDSSALMAGILSSQGASRALLLLSEFNLIKLVVSEQVIAEVERNIAKKAPKVLVFVREMIRESRLSIYHNPNTEDLQLYMDWISHKADVPILVASIQAKVDYLVTLNSKHFLSDRTISVKSGIMIGSPGDALTWVRSQLSRK